ncbi:MAG: SpoIIE family protein phosphatase, partial [Bacteroidota bacterium]
LSIVVYRNYSHKKKANILLTDQKNEIEEKNEELKQSNEEISAQRDEIETQRDLVTFQKEKIEEIHSQLTSSIHYAKRIQNAVLPEKEFIDTLLNDYFILFKPRDIVSGDFFWMTMRKKHLLVAVADCTGHGVPGAFISMLGISFLNDIVARDDVTKASHVINVLREYILKSLQQKGNDSEQKDGMDIAFICVNMEPEYTESGTEQFNVQYAGANNSLYIAKTKVEEKVVNDYSSTIVEIKGDKMPISIYRNMNDFTNHELILQKGDIIYLCTDGFYDQYGGPHDRKYLSMNFRKLLDEISGNSMETQKEILNETIESWMNYNGKTHEQTDDITVMGIKI